MGISAKRAAILILPIALAACAGSDDSRSISFMGGGGANAAQPFPANYRSELLAFTRTSRPRSPTRTMMLISAVLYAVPVARAAVG